MEFRNSNEHIEAIRKHDICNWDKNYWAITYCLIDIDPETSVVRAFPEIRSIYEDEKEAIKALNLLNSRVVGKQLNKYHLHVVRMHTYKD